MEKKEAARCLSCGGPMIKKTVADAEGIKHGPLLCEKCEGERARTVKGLPGKLSRPPAGRSPRKSHRG